MHILREVELKERTFLWICLWWDCLMSRKSFYLCFFLQRNTNSHSAFCEALDKIVYFWDCFLFARCCDCTSFFFLENQTKIALQLILLFQANYPDTLKATTTTKYSVAVPLLSESGLAPEDVPRLLSVPKSGTWHSLCSCLRHESESQIFLLV